MKKRIFNLIMLAFIISILSGCAMHNGYMVNSAALGSNNFKYVKKGAIGTAKATYIFGIGGHSKITLVDAAKKTSVIRSSAL